MRIKAPLEELRDARLYHFLAALSQEYSERITTFLSEIAPHLASIARFFPYYTRHDANHGYRVIRRIEMILAPDNFDPTSESALGITESFLLIAAAYAHDLGMTVFPGEERRLLGSLSLSMDNPGWETHPELQSFLRKNHASRGGKYIAENAERLGLPFNLVGQLDWMMKSHNFSIPELDKKLKEPFAAEERVIDVRQLAVILCIADAIEFSDTRVVDGVLDMISIDQSDAARESYRENMKHACIEDSLAIDEHGRIVVSGTFQDSKVLSLAHHTFDQIEEWIKGYCDIDRRSLIRRLRVRPEPLQRRLELVGARYERLGIRISKKNVIDLISSNAIWRSNTGVPIRELLQNSVEACRYRKFHTPSSDRYLPRVFLTFNRVEKTITIEDNGCGMSERVVLNHFLTVGNSRATEKAYATEDYAPIARFGIGFWSIFTIADQASIKTLAFEDADDAGQGDGIAFEIEIDDLKDYTVFSDQQSEAGTTITLHLKPGIVVDEVFEQTLKQVLCSEVEMIFKHDGDTQSISKVTPIVSDEEILGAKQLSKRELGIETFQWSGTARETEVTLGFGYRIENGLPTFVNEGGVPMLLDSLSIRSPQHAICGFRTNIRGPALSFDIMRVGTYFANYKTPHGIEFSIDRQSLVQNEASLRFTDDVAQLAHSGYRQFLENTGSQNPEAIFALNEQSHRNGGNVFDTFTGGELAYAYFNYPDLLCFKLIPVQPHSTAQTVRSEFVDLNTLAKKAGVVWVIQSTYRIPQGNGGQYLIFQPEALLQHAYEYAKRCLNQIGVQQDVFVVEPNRQASMLFDGDPDSTVKFFQTHLQPGQSTDICIQRISLQNVRFTSQPEGILAEVQGRWTGAVYLRDFVTPNGRPYAFLGRSRVLVQKSSRLRSYLGDLRREGRLSKLAETIAMLREDEAGFTVAAIKELL